MNTANTSKKNSFAPQWEASNHETNAYSFFFFSPVQKETDSCCSMGGGTQRKGGRVQKESQREDQGYHHATPREARHLYPGMGVGAPQHRHGGALSLWVS